MKIVIIGGVAAGASCAARLRRLDENAEIIVLERGPYISYANCGLPYHVGNVIPDQDDLLLMDPELMDLRYNVDVRVNSTATAIDRSRKTVHVRTPQREYDESYDHLLIATGSSPIRPNIPGIDSPGIYSLWTVPDTEKIKAIVDQTHPKTAAVIGGGFIGLEMAENLVQRGVHVDLIEAENQVMRTLDPEMAAVVENELERNNVTLHLEERVTDFHQEAPAAGSASPQGPVTITTESGKQFTVDMVILSVGTRPNGELAKAAGLKVNSRGGIIVDRSLRTEDRFIWAAGDVIEVEQRISGQKVMIPLAGPANKQGRLAADNIIGLSRILSGGAPGGFSESSGSQGDYGRRGSDSRSSASHPLLKEYPGSLGTSIAKVFGLSAASTGLTERQVLDRGLRKNRDFYTLVVNQKSHAGYYPGACSLFLKLIFDDRGRILGAQCVGPEGVDKRIDTVAAAACMGGTVHNLTELELAYAPPYSSAKDPVNMAGFCAENVLEGMTAFVSPAECDEMTGANRALFLDVRTPGELAQWSYPGGVNIPLEQLRSRAGELPRDRVIITSCRIGVRAYVACRILRQLGFQDVRVLEGSMEFYTASHRD